MSGKAAVLALLVVMLLSMFMVDYVFYSESAERELHPDVETGSMTLLKKQGTWIRNVTGSPVAMAEEDELSTVSKLPFNTASETKPNLIVSSISYAPARSGKGDRVMFSVVVENSGSVGAGGFVVACYVDGVKLDEYSLTDLSGGASSAMTFYWDAVGVGSHTVRVVADVYDVVAEEDEADNELAVAFSVGPKLEPDLVISSLSWTPVDPTEGDLVAFKFTVENLVAVYAGGFTTAYYVDDSEVGSHYITVSVDTMTFYWDAVGVGSHTVRVVADVYNVVAEADETNNVLELPFSVHANAPSTTLTLKNGPTSESCCHPRTTNARYYGTSTEELSTEELVELSYDDDSAEGWLGPGSSSPLGPHIWIVLFSSPLESTQLFRAAFYVNATINGQDALDFPCRVHIMDFNKSNIFLLEVTPSNDGWFIVDLEPYSLIVPQHFFVGVEVFLSLQENEGGYIYLPALGYDNNEPDGKSWWINRSGEDTWISLETYDVMIRTVVGPPSKPTDLDGSGKVDIIDLAIVGIAFGTRAGDPNYNATADLAEPYGEINITDIATVAQDFGKNSAA